jgi:hypothetical protein
MRHVWEKGGFYAYRIVVEKPERKRPFGKPGRRWEKNIKIDFKDICWEDVNWIHLAQDLDKWWAVVSTIMNLQIP